MKKILCILATILISINAFSNRNSSELILRSDNHSFFKAKVNGIMYTPINNKIALPNIGIGTFEVQFYRFSPSHHGHRRDMHVVSYQYINIGHGETVIASINGRNQVRLEYIRSHHREPVACHTKPYKQPYKAHHKRTVVTHAYPQDHNRELSYYEMKIERAAFDDDKLEIAYNALNNIRMNTIEAKHIMDLLTFEKSKLAFAKYAYTRVSDPDNYYRIENNLTFRSSKEELQRYMSRNYVCHAH